MTNDTIKIGWARTEITPPGPCMLAGQMRNRLATEVLDPLTSTVLALESGSEKVIIISADLGGIRMPLMNCGTMPNVWRATASKLSNAPRCNGV